VLEKKNDLPVKRMVNIYLYYFMNNWPVYNVFLILNI